MKVTDLSQSALSARKSGRFWISFILLSVAIGLVIFYGWPGDKVRQVADNEKSQSKRAAASDGGRNEHGANSPNASSGSQPSVGIVDTAESRATRRREALANRSRAPKSVVDLMASWSDQPPWPEGPRLYAEVETSSKKYINLRPDDYGVLPRIQTGPGELLEIKITLPESEPGEKIHHGRPVVTRTNPTG